MRENSMFKVGDKVTYEFQPGRTGIGSVVYGPFNLAGAGTQMCVVEWLAGDFKGEAQTLPMERLKPTPRFEVGQVVQAKYLTSGLVKVAAGPFKGDHSLWYVLELPDGRHSMEIEVDIAPVEE